MTHPDITTSTSDMLQGVTLCWGQAAAPRVCLTHAAPFFSICLAVVSSAV